MYPTTGYMPAYVGGGGGGWREGEGGRESDWSVLERVAKG